MHTHPTSVLLTSRLNAGPANRLARLERQLLFSLRDRLARLQSMQIGNSPEEVSRN